MTLLRTSLSALVVLLGVGVSPSVSAEPKPATENLLIVMTDGLRWQEVFAGADDSLLNKERGGIPNPAEIRREFWRDDVQARRAALMPFTWTVLAREGQLYGNRLKRSTARVTNGLNFSYPGYSETFCGFADPRIDSNKKIPNPNINVLEWLNQKPSYRGRVAAVTSWDVFPAILNVQRSGLEINAGFEQLNSVPETPEVRLLNRLVAETPPSGTETRYDAFTYYAAVEYLKARKPRVLLVSFDETDNFGHAGRYDRVLQAARKVDGYVKGLWEMMQALPAYRGKTTLVFAPIMDEATHRSTGRATARRSRARSTSGSASSAPIRRPWASAPTFPT